MIDIGIAIPLVTATLLSFSFKNTRGLGIIMVAVFSFIFPVYFLALASIAGVVFCIYKFGGKS